MKGEPCQRPSSRSIIRTRPATYDVVLDDIPSSAPWRPSSGTSVHGRRGRFVTGGTNPTIDDLRSPNPCQLYEELGRMQPRVLLQPTRCSSSDPPPLQLGGGRRNTPIITSSGRRRNGILPTQNPADAMMMILRHRCFDVHEAVMILSICTLSAMTRNTAIEPRDWRHSCDRRRPSPRHRSEMIRSAKGIVPIRRTTRRRPSFGFAASQRAASIEIPVWVPRAPRHLRARSYEARPARRAP